MRTPKQIASAKKWRKNFNFATRTLLPIKNGHKGEFIDDDVKIPQKFDCTNCGDPTHGSYHGAIMSNMCWKCTTEHNRDYDEWLSFLNLKIREVYE